MSGNPALSRSKNSVLPIRPSNARGTHKVSIKPRKVCTASVQATQAPENHGCNLTGTPPQPILSGTFQNRLLAAQQSQEAWLNSATQEVTTLRLQHEEVRRISRQARQQVEDQQHQERQRLQELQQAFHQARLVESTERKRLELLREETERVRLAQERQERRDEADRLRREAYEEERRQLEERIAEVEQRRVEAKRIRLEAEEAERQRLAAKAAEAERQRLEAAEAERRRIEAEAAEAERLRLEAEEAERQRQEAERQRLAAEAAEAERLRLEAVEAERIRRERERECAVCMDRHDMSFMIKVPCPHWYCPEDLSDAFQNALDSGRPFQCCGQEVPISLLPANLLQLDFIVRYDLLLLELATPNRTYCSNRNCGSFVPPTQYQGPDIALCLACGYNTCRHCNAPHHPGRDCPEDEATQQALHLGAARGWRRCPGCRNLVERIDGCNHMTCQCRQEFCYVCAAIWRTCSH